uniref:Si:dkeyp-81f3.4 n=1 Tax=Labrus bergylta TaxID=56723 RepID=A0A3Q3EFE6_9LABR
METISQTKQNTNAGNSVHRLQLPHGTGLLFLEAEVVMEVDSYASNPKLSAESARLVEHLKERHRSDTKEQVGSSPNGDLGNINWMASEDFTAEVGKSLINKCIQSWELQPCWLYSLDFLHSTEEEEDHDTFYHYRARFSTPTPRKPIQGTAGVYFVVGISKVKPRTLPPVEVLFTVESNRLVHTPGRSRFTEKWLADVIEIHV